MILAGDYIETTIGFTLGISTMAAAALGVLIADVLGLSVGGLIEEISVSSVRRQCLISLLSVRCG
jgi:hypothetical protein